MINTICIGSGGFRGISFLSALIYLEKHNDIDIEKVKTYTCVSVGCFISLLLIVGYTLNDLYDTLKETDKYKPEMNLDLIFDEYGFDNGQKLILYFKSLLLKKIDNPNISFLELYKLTKKKIYVATTNFTKNEERIFLFSKENADNIDEIWDDTALIRAYEKSVRKIKNSGRSHAHKIQAAVAMEQRAKEMGKASAAAVYRKYINSF